MTITLPPHMELLLHERAEQERRPADEVALSILSEALLFNSETRADIVAGLDQALKEHREGRTRTLEEVSADLRARYGLSGRVPGSGDLAEVAPGVFLEGE